MSVETLLASLKNEATEVTQVQPTASKGLPVTPTKKAEVTEVTNTGNNGGPVTPVTPTKSEGVTQKAIQAVTCTPVTPVTPKKIKGQIKTDLPAHVQAALEAAGVVLPDELPAWTPEHCQEFLLMVKGVSSEEVRLRGPLGFHGIDCPDRWGVEFNTVLQSIYVQAMQCDEKAWRDFLDRFDGVK